MSCSGAALWYASLFLFYRINFKVFELTGNSWASAANNQLPQDSQTTEGWLLRRRSRWLATRECQPRARCSQDDGEYNLHLLWRTSHAAASYGLWSYILLLLFKRKSTDRFQFYLHQMWGHMSGEWCAMCLNIYRCDFYTVF